MLVRASTILVVTISALVACDRGKAQDEDSTVEPQPVTNTGATVNAPPGGLTKADSISAAGNARSVSRYADEVPLPPTTKRLVPTTTARTMPLGPQAVAVFESGGDVTVLAKRGSYYLVMFPDPKDAQQELAGWIYKDAIGAMGTASAASGPSAAFTCANGEVHVLADGLCARACTHDADCTAVGGVCDGNGPVANGSHALGRAQYCVVATQ